MKINRRSFIAGAAALAASPALASVPVTEPFYASFARVKGPYVIIDHHKFSEYYRLQETNIGINSFVYRFRREYFPGKIIAVEFPTRYGRQISAKDLYFG